MVKLLKKIFEWLRRYVRLLILSPVVGLIGCGCTSNSLPPITDLYTASEKKWALVIDQNEKADTKQLRQEVLLLSQQLQQAQRKVDVQSQLITHLRRQLKTNAQIKKAGLQNTSIIKDASALIFKKATSVTVNKQSTAKIDWEAAVQLLKKERYQEAKEALENFIQHHLADTHQAEAHYFLGQIALLQGKLDDAIACFKLFIQKYPHDRRVADANFYIGLTYYAKQDNTAASKCFEKVEKLYPNTSAAMQAKQQRKQLKLG